MEETRCAVGNVNYEFLSRLSIKTGKKNRAKKTWLTIGIVCCVLLALIELLRGDFKGMTVLVPMLFMISLRVSLGAGTVCIDVPVIFQYENDLVRIHFSGIVKLPGSAFGSKQYLFPPDKIKEIVFDSKSQLISISANANVHTLNEANQSTSSYSSNNEMIQFSIPDEYQDRILGCLSQTVSIRRL